MSTEMNTGGPAFPNNGEQFVIGPDGSRQPQSAYGMQGSEGMSLRQYAAIALKVPDSGEEWLDQMIRQSLRDDMAGKAMQTLVAMNGPRGGLSGGVDAHPEVLAHRTYEYADAMMRMRESYPQMSDKYCMEQGAMLAAREQK